MAPVSLPVVRSDPDLDQLTRYIDLWKDGNFELSVKWATRFRHIKDALTGIPTAVVEQTSTLIKPIFDVLVQPLPDYITKPKTTKTHTSSPSNETYKKYRLYARQIFDVTIDLPRAQEFFDFMIGSVDGPFTLWPPTVQEVEGDVNDHVYYDFLAPCECAVNDALRRWYKHKGLSGGPPVVIAYAQQHIKGQDRDDPDTGELKMFPDHTFISEYKGTRKCILFVEEKMSPSVNMDHLETFTTKAGKIIAESKFEDMREHLAQIIKYVQRTDCNFSVITDAKTCIAMQWIAGNQNELGENIKLHYWNMECKKEKPQKQERVARLSLLALLSIALDKAELLNLQERQ